MMLAWRLLWRQRKAGELWIMLSALLLAVATVVAIAIFAQRIQSSLLSEAGALIAADLQVSGSEPLPDSVLALAERNNLIQSQSMNFQATLITDAGLQLGAVRAVDNLYPLKGDLTISAQPFGEESLVQGGPAPGELWLVSRLFSVLGLEPGDSLRLGDVELRATQAIIREPDSAGAFFGVNPRVMMNLEDVPSANIQGAGARIRYQLSVVGSESDVQNFRSQLEAQYPELRISSPRDSSDAIANALDSGQRFLLLAGSMAVILAGVAVALASARFGHRQANTVAILKSLGLGPAAILRLYVQQFVLMGLLAISLGLALGWSLHALLLWLLRDFFPQQIAAASLAPLGLGFATGWIALLGFALPPIWRLRQISPMAVLRQNQLGAKGQWQQWLFGLLAIIALLWFYSRDAQLTLYVLLSLAVMVLLLLLVAWALLYLARQLSRSSSKFWRLGIANLYRHRRFNALQLVVFSVTLMLLYLMVLVRTDLINSWQQQVPDGAANHFAFNLYQEDLPAFERWLDEQQVQAQPLYPVIRGRFHSIAGETLEQRTANLGDRSGEFSRELNLTWSEHLAADNQLLAGQWWPQGYDDQELLVSLEESWARALNLELGDYIEVRVGGLIERARVHNIRSVDWQSFNPNFYLIFNQPLLDGFGATYLTSFYLPPEQKPSLNELVRAQPNVAIIEVDAIINQVRDIVDRISAAIEFILLLVLAAGSLVLLASVLATLDVRMRESALLRALGAGRALVRGLLSIEFLALGLLAGLMASLGAQLAIIALQTQVFDLSWRWYPSLWLLGPMLAALLIWGLGSLATARVVKIPPLWVLRQ